MMRRFADFMLSFGSYPGEPETQRAKRRIVVAAMWISTVLTVPTVLSDYSAGYTWVAAANAVVLLAFLPLIVGLGRFPHRFEFWINAEFVMVLTLILVEVALMGGLIGSGLSPLFGLIIVVGSLIAFGVRSAIWWFGAFIASIAYSVMIPNWVDALYVVEDPTLDVAFSVAATGLVVLAVMIYFVRQRDRFQKESDDLLHNILPDEIATRLKASSGMIADSYEAASVLICGRCWLHPHVSRHVTQRIRGIVEQPVLYIRSLRRRTRPGEDQNRRREYMVASGIPTERPDHATAIAELALRMRNALEADRFEGHEIRMRIGINSGPVVAGIIGTHKFAYDLWGDAVNTASRMESEGIKGSIQVSEATYRLVNEEFVCEPRGEVSIKGKGSMKTYLLVSRRSPNRPTTSTP